MHLKICLFILLVLSIAASAADEEMAFELLPRGRPFRLTFADPREIRMGLSIEGDARILAAIGNYFSLVSWATPDQASRLHIGLEGAGYFGMRQDGSRFPLETADGLIGIYCEGSLGAFQWQGRFTHISAHLADGSSATPIPFSREFMTFRAGYLVTPDLHLYAGTSWLTNSVPKVPGWAFQLGSSFFLPSLNWLVLPFYAFDLKWRQETAYNPSLSLQLGIALNNPPEAFRSFRVFYSYFTGGDPRGQFYDHSLTSHSLGLEMQI